MMKRILWLSRHRPHPRQVEELCTMHGQEVVIEQEQNPFDDVRQIARRYRQSGYCDLVIVAPLSVIQVLCSEGIHPLWAECAEENNPAKIDFRGVRNQGFRFVRFRRIKRIAMEFFED
jgi:hypothetical protein